MPDRFKRNGIVRWGFIANDLTLQGSGASTDTLPWERNPFFFLQICKTDSKLKKNKKCHDQKHRQYTKYNK